MSATAPPTLSDIDRQAAVQQLAVFGAFHPGSDDATPPGTGTLILFGPREPGFWAHVTAAPEFADGAADPLDRWSARAIGALAEALRGTALYPFGGPPWHPFIGWAKRAGTAWESPVGLLIHAQAGLMVSYRGALALPHRLALPPAPACPCESCAQPCRTACPVGALSPAGYDIPACHAYLDTGPGADCRDAGCAVRRACPVSQSYGRRAAQSAFHMRSFHP